MAVESEHPTRPGAPARRAGGLTPARHELDRPVNEVVDWIDVDVQHVADTGSTVTGLAVSAASTSAERENLADANPAAVPAHGSAGPSYAGTSAAGRRDVSSSSPSITTDAQGSGSPCIRDLRLFTNVAGRDSLEGEAVAPIARGLCNDNVDSVPASPGRAHPTMAVRRIRASVGPPARRSAAGPRRRPGAQPGARPGAPAPGSATRGARSARVRAHPAAAPPGLAGDGRAS